MITLSELELYIELIKLYYGADYVNTFEDLSEMIELEFDLQINPVELARIMNMTVDSEDILLNYKACGIQY